MTMWPEYTARLRELPFVTEVQVEPVAAAHADYGFDARVVLVTPESEVELLAQLKTSNIGYALADLLIASAAHLERGWLLLAPYIGGPLGQYLTERGVNYLDLQGNCHLDLGGRYLAHVEGRRGPERRATHTGVRRAGYQVLFALLADRELTRAPVRNIADRADVSRHAVSTMLARLVEEGLLVRTERARHHWVSHRWRDGLDRWLVGYADVVRPALLLGRYSVRNADPEVLEPLIQSRLKSSITWRWGGSAAGYRLVGHYRGPDTVIHVEAQPNELPRRLEALPDANGRLVVLTFPGRVALEGRTDDTPHPLLVYSEMMASGDERSREAAQLVLNDHLERS